jgi:hypothetical protein
MNACAAARSASTFAAALSAAVDTDSTAAFACSAGAEDDTCTKHQMLHPLKALIGLLTLDFKFTPQTCAMQSSSIVG